MPANTFSIIRPAGEAVSAQGSASERRPVPDRVQPLTNREQVSGRASKSVEAGDEDDVLAQPLGRRT